MASKTCVVNKTCAGVSDAFKQGGFASATVRDSVQAVLKQLEEIVGGRAQATAIVELGHSAKALADLPCNQGLKIAQMVSTALKEAAETFQSHVETHICPDGDCPQMTPAPCQMACPAGIDVPGYVALIGQKRFTEAIELIRHDNPLPWVCGLVCTRPCESRCVRARIDTPIAIKTLKAFAAQMALTHTRPDTAAVTPSKQKICVVGAGPAGLSAAYYLAQSGYRVQVIEAQSVAGGMIFLGIPRYRLPADVITREVDELRALGVEFRFNTRFGADVNLTSLQAEGFEAFFMAIGAHKSYKLGIIGETDFPQILEAVDFLRDVALGDENAPGKNIVVVGGGNVAIDAARTCIRLGCAQVTIAYRRTRNEMPADHEEIEQALEEGVDLKYLTVPIEVTGADNRVSALTCLKARLVAMEGRNRMSPVPIEDSRFDIEADVVIAAIGQQVDSASLAGCDGLAVSRRKTIKIDPVTMATNIDGVFAAGDAVSGPATVVEAIGGGKRAAQAIERYLTGLSQPKQMPLPVRRTRIDFLPSSAKEQATLKRPAMNMLEMSRRLNTFDLVELGFSENDAVREARRCLRCDVCIRCGECVRICKDEMGIGALELGFTAAEKVEVPTDFTLTANKCITCGACAVNCPNDAMQISNDDGQRTLAFCGKTLNRQPLIVCDGCGKVLGSAAHLEFIKTQTDPIPKTAAQNNLCQHCLRQQGAQSLAIF